MSENQTFYGYPVERWLEIRRALNNENIQIDEARKLQTMLRERRDMLRGSSPVISEDIDARIRSAVARGVADANTEALNENMELRAENAKLLRFLEAVQMASTEYECDGVF